MCTRWSRQSRASWNRRDETPNRWVLIQTGLSTEGRISILCYASAQLVEVGRQQVPQPSEPGMATQIGAHIVQRARHVLDVDRIAARRGLKSERTERFEVALQGHQIETEPELLGILRYAAPQREEVG